MSSGLMTANADLLEPNRFHRHPHRHHHLSYLTIRSISPSPLPEEPPTITSFAHAHTHTHTHRHLAQLPDKYDDAESINPIVLPSLVPHLSQAAARHT